MARDLMCARCKNHGFSSSLRQLKGHEKRCRFRKHGIRKKCLKCKLSLGKRDLQKQQIALRREQDYEQKRKQNPQLRNHPGEVSDSDDLDSDIEDIDEKVDQATQTINQEPLPVFKEAVTNPCNCWQFSAAMEQLWAQHLTALHRFAREQPMVAFHLLLPYLPNNDPFCLVMQQSFPYSIQTLGTIS